MTSFLIQWLAGRWRFDWQLVRWLTCRWRWSQPGWWLLPSTGRELQNQSIWTAFVSHLWLQNCEDLNWFLSQKCNRNKPRLVFYMTLSAWTKSSSKTVHMFVFFRLNVMPYALNFAKVSKIVWNQGEILPLSPLSLSLSLHLHHLITCW